MLGEERYHESLVYFDNPDLQSRCSNVGGADAA